MKRIISLFLIAVLVVILTACGNKTDGNNTSGMNNANDENGTTEQQTILNDGIEYIWDDAFMGNKALKKVFIPASAKGVSNRAFGFTLDDEPVEGFVAYFEEEADMSNMLRAGATCVVATREEAGK